MVTCTGQKVYIFIMEVILVMFVIYEFLVCYSRMLLLHIALTYLNFNSRGNHASQTFHVKIFMESTCIDLDASCFACDDMCMWLSVIRELCSTGWRVVCEHIFWETNNPDEIKLYWTYCWPFVTEHKSILISGDQAGRSVQGCFRVHAVRPAEVQRRQWWWAPDKRGVLHSFWWVQSNIMPS